MVTHAWMQPIGGAAQEIHIVDGETANRIGQCGRVSRAVFVGKSFVEGAIVGSIPTR